MIFLIVTSGRDCGCVALADQCLECKIASYSVVPISGIIASCRYLDTLVFHSAPRPKAKIKIYIYIFTFVGSVLTHQLVGLLVTFFFSLIVSSGTDYILQSLYPPPVFVISLLSAGFLLVHQPQCVPVPADTLTPFHLSPGNLDFPLFLLPSLGFTFSLPVVCLFHYLLSQFITVFVLKLFSEY